jgi:hypothetical protein
METRELYRKWAFWLNLCAYTLIFGAVLGLILVAFILQDLHSATDRAVFSFFLLVLLFFGYLGYLLYHSGKHMNLFYQSEQVSDYEISLKNQYFFWRNLVVGSAISVFLFIVIVNN